MPSENRVLNHAVRYRLAMLAAVLGLSACNLVPPQLPPLLTEVEETTQFVPVPLGQAWVNAPGAVIVTERGLVNSLEQRIGLENRTAVSGDNMLTLRARVVEGQQQGRFRYEEFLRRIGGLPAPFGALKPGDLLTGEDDLGTYFWAENRAGANTVCVLGLRRLGTGIRQMPGNTNVMDVMLRNCVNGEAEQALEPLMAASIGYIPGVGTTPDRGGIEMLSPLAGPTPQ